LTNFFFLFEKMENTLDHEKGEKDEFKINFNSNWGFSQKMNHLYSIEKSIKDMNQELMASIDDFRKHLIAEYESIQKLTIGAKLDSRVLDSIMSRRIVNIETHEEIIQSLQKRISFNNQQLFKVADIKLQVFNGLI